MFQMFSNPRVENHQSTSIGLGLSYCKELVKHFNGNIKCDSELGVGSSFIFSIIAGRNPRDLGLSKAEELHHQFKIAKLIKHNYVPLGSESIRDTVVTHHPNQRPHLVQISNLSAQGSKGLSFS